MEHACLPLRVSAPFAVAGRRIQLSIDGSPIDALEGESLAASLTAAGAAHFRPSAAGDTRGLFCGMGVCRECVVTVDGRPGTRACMVASRDGMVVSTLERGAAPDGFVPRTGDQVTASPDVLVIGGGPAGLSAALAAAQAGARVTLLEERQALGGQYFKPLASSHALPADCDAQFRAGADLVEAVRRAGVTIHTHASVWGAFDGLELMALVDESPVLFRPRRLVVATGAYECGVPFPGWTLPGVMTTGAGQTLVRSQRVSPGRRVVIAGNGPLNLQLAAEMLRAGIDVVAVAEAAPSPGVRCAPDALSMLSNDWQLTRDGLSLMRMLAGRMRWGTVVRGAQGSERCERVTLARIDAQGNAIPGSDETIEAAALCTGYGFMPSHEISRMLGCRHEASPTGRGLLAVRDAAGRSSVPEVFIAGDCGGFGGGRGGARAALAEGTLAGAAAAADLGLVDAGFSAPRLQAKLDRHRAFQRALWRLFRAPLLTTQLARSDTPVCRCESVTLQEVRAAFDEGSATPGAVKKHTRAGMGRCQGRYCGALIGSICGRAGEFDGFHPRVPARPLPLWQVAGLREVE